MVETLLAGKSLSFTVSQGGSVMVNMVAVVVSDIMTANGCVIHVIDTVLVPSKPASIVSFLQDPSTSPGFTSSYSYKFTKLVAAATTAGLASTLETTSGLTLFAPTDAAFTQLEESLGSTSMDTTTLANVLKYHVLSGMKMSEVITGASSLPWRYSTTMSSH